MSFPHAPWQVGSLESAPRMMLTLYVMLSENVLRVYLG